MTAALPAPRPEQPDAEQLLAGIRGNVYRLTITTSIEYLRDPIDRGKHQRSQQVKGTAYAEPLLTALRDSIRPSQGATDTGRGGGASSLPFNDNALTLLTSIEADIAGMYRSGLELEPIGTSEQLLLEWFREFEFSYRAGDVVDAQLTNLLIRIRGWRFAIEDHFTPPRKQELNLCPECGYTHFEKLLHGEIIWQRCVTVTYWPSTVMPGTNRRPPIAECAHCQARWVNTDELTDLAARVDEIYQDAIKKHSPITGPIVAPLPDPADTDEPDTEESTTP